MKTNYKARLRYVFDTSAHATETERQWALPATPEAYDAQVEAMAKAVRGQIDCGDDEMVLSTDACIFALAAIGINRPKRNPATGSVKEETK